MREYENKLKVFGRVALCILIQHKSPSLLLQYAVIYRSTKNKYVPTVTINSSSINHNLDESHYISIHDNDLDISLAMQHCKRKLTTNLDMQGKQNQQDLHIYKTVYLQ